MKAYADGCRYYCIPAIFRGENDTDAVRHLKIKYENELGWSLDPDNADVWVVRIGTAVSEEVAWSTRKVHKRKICCEPKLPKCVQRNRQDLCYTLTIQLELSLGILITNTRDLQAAVRLTEYPGVRQKRVKAITAHAVFFRHFTDRVRKSSVTRWN